MRPGRRATLSATICKPLNNTHAVQTRVAAFRLRMVARQIARPNLLPYSGE